MPKPPLPAVVPPGPEVPSPWVSELHPARTALAATSTAHETAKPLFRFMNVMSDARRRAAHETRTAEAPPADRRYLILQKFRGFVFAVGPSSWSNHSQTESISGETCAGTAYCTVTDGHVLHGR